MFNIVKPDARWSDIGLRFLIGSIIASIFLALADGVLRSGNASNHFNYLMVATWVVDFRYLADQGVYAATIFFVGAKFFETRTIFSVGFDKLEAGKIQVKGPDEDNVVWIGHRYATKLEAQAIADAMGERLKQSAA